jgi:hypothetical protein
LYIKPINNSCIYKKHPHWCNTHMYYNGLHHPQLTHLWRFITWKIVLTSSIGHHQIIVQEHECQLQVLVLVDKHLLSTNNLCMKHPHWCNTQKYNDGFSHTKLTLFPMFITSFDLKYKSSTDHCERTRWLPMLGLKLVARW